MKTFTLTEAKTLVRKNLDELDPNGSIMYSADGDNQSVDDIILHNLPEAINVIHLAAPAVHLDGIAYTFGAGDAVTVSTDGILSFKLSTEEDFLRLVGFKAADSAIVVTDTLDEASPEGRKQLNKFIRGTYDRPRLVQIQGTYPAPEFKYYTIAKPTPYTRAEDPVDAKNAISFFHYVKRLSYDADATGYDYSARLKQNIADYLTYLVLETYSDQRAQAFYQKASAYI